MAHESFIIEIEGEEADFYEDVVSLEVELNDELPATFKLEIGLPIQADGTWAYLDDERFRVWKQVVIQGGFVEGSHEELITGYITHVRTLFDSDPTRCVLEVSGIDGSVLMDREEKLKDWPDEKDSDIATEIFGLYGFTASVEDTAIIHEEALSTIIQRETDYRFLQRLAHRNGFACYVEGANGYFGPLPAETTPQPVLAAHFEEETTLQYFTTTVDALRPVNVAMFQVDRLNKEVLSALIETSTLEALGDLDAAGLLTNGVEAGKVYVGKNAATGMPEMEALCQGLFQEGAWFVSGEGKIESALYEHVLKPRGMVTIKGIGETYSGVYYVTHVRHTFTQRGYSQFFRVKRDGVMVTGSEDFASSGGLAGGLL